MLPAVVLTTFADGSTVRVGTGIDGTGGLIELTLNGRRLLQLDTNLDGRADRIELDDWNTSRRLELEDRDFDGRFDLRLTYAMARADDNGTYLARREVLQSDGGWTLEETWFQPNRTSDFAGPDTKPKGP